jgi:hypothetical protein
MYIAIKKRKNGKVVMILKKRETVNTKYYGPKAGRAGQWLG